MTRFLIFTIKTSPDLPVPYIFGILASRQAKLSDNETRPLLPNIWGTNWKMRNFSMNTSWQDPTLAPEGDASLKPVPVQVEQAERGDGFLCVLGSTPIISI